MLPLRLLWPNPPSRLVASSRRATSALRRQEMLGGNVRDFRTCAVDRFTHPRGCGCSSKFPRPEPPRLVGGERFFSSRDDHDGSEGFQDSWASPPQLSEEREPGAVESDGHVSEATPILDADDDPNAPPSVEEDGLGSVNDSDYGLKESARVHPLSQLVLLFFQTDEGYDWITGSGSVPPSLRINEDGTFVLTFPSDPIRNGVGNEESGLRASDKSGPGPDVPKRQIWTQFGKGKHWLCVSVGDKATPFLLQDCSLSTKSKGRGRMPVSDEGEMYTPWKVGIHAHPKPTLADHVEDAVRAAMREIDSALVAG
jgi:hypothetical protein